MRHTQVCLVMEMRLDGRLPMPKHLAFHEPHDWWYISWGGGHQMDTAPAPDDVDYNRAYDVYCPGWRP